MNSNTFFDDERVFILTNYLQKIADQTMSDLMKIVHNDMDRFLCGMQTVHKWSKIQVDKLTERVSVTFPKINDLYSYTAHLYSQQYKDKLGLDIGIAKIPDFGNFLHQFHINIIWLRIIFVIVIL